MKKLLSAIISIATAAVLAINIAAAVPTIPQIPPTDLSTLPTVPNAETLAKATDYAGTHFYDESEVIDKLTALGYEAEQKLRVPPLQPDIALMGSGTYMIEVRKDDILCARIYFYVWEDDYSPTGWDLEMGFCAVYDTDLFSTGFDFATSDTDEQAIEKAVAQGFRQGSGHELGEELPHDLQFTNGEFDVELAREGDLTVYVVEKHKCKYNEMSEEAERYNDYGHWSERTCWCGNVIRTTQYHTCFETGDPMICDKCGDYFSGVYIGELFGKPYDEVKEALEKSAGEDMVKAAEETLICNIPDLSVYITINFTLDRETAVMMASGISLSIRDCLPVTYDGLTYCSTYEEVLDFAERTDSDILIDNQSKAKYKQADIDIRTPDGVFYHFEGLSCIFDDDGNIVSGEFRIKNIGYEYLGLLLPDLSDVNLENLVGMSRSEVEAFAADLAEKNPFFLSGIYKEEGSQSVLSFGKKLTLKITYEKDIVDIMSLSISGYANASETDPIASADFTYLFPTAGDIINSGFEYDIYQGRITVKTPSGAYIEYTGYNEAVGESSKMTIMRMSPHYCGGAMVDLSEVVLSDFLNKDLSYLEAFAEKADYSFYSYIVEKTAGYDGAPTVYDLKIGGWTIESTFDKWGKINKVRVSGFSESDVPPKNTPNFPLKFKTDVGTLLSLLESGEYEYTVTEINYEENNKNNPVGSRGWNYEIYADGCIISTSFSNMISEYNPATGRYENRLMSDEEVKAEITWINEVRAVKPEYILADVNGDGEATLDDAIKTLQASMQVDIGSDNFIEQAADLTGDGKITLDDAIEILKIAMKVEG